MSKNEIVGSTRCTCERETRSVQQLWGERVKFHHSCERENFRRLLQLRLTYRASFLYISRVDRDWKLIKYSRNESALWKPFLAEEIPPCCTSWSWYAWLCPIIVYRKYTRPISGTSATEVRGNPFHSSAPKRASFEHFLEENGTGRTSITRGIV